MNRITLQGFIVLDYFGKIPEFRELITKAAVDGTIKLDGLETLVKVDKLEEVPKVWHTLFDGANQGKLVTQIAKL